MKSLVYDLMYVDMSMLLKSLVVCVIAYLLMNPVSKSIEKATSYSPSNGTSKVIMYIAAVLAIATLILNGASSPLRDGTRALLLISVLALYGVLVFVNRRAGIGRSIIVSLLQVLGSVAFSAMFVIAIFLGGAGKSSYNASNKSSGSQTGFDAEIQERASSYNQQTRQQAQQYAEAEARRMGFNNAQEARESGFNIPENH